MYILITSQLGVNSVSQYLCDTIAPTLQAIISKPELQGTSPILTRPNGAKLIYYLNNLYDSLAVAF